MDRLTDAALFGKILVFLEVHLPLVAEADESGVLGEPAGQVVLGQDDELGTLDGCGSDEFRGFVEVVLKLEWLHVLMLAKHGR
jgi:hypothetical protein